MSNKIRIGYSIHSIEANGEYNVTPVSNEIDVSDINHIKLVKDDSDNCVWVTVNKNINLFGKYSYHSYNNINDLKQIVKIIKKNNISYDIYATDGAKSWDITLNDI